MLLDTRESLKLKYVIPKPLSTYLMTYYQLVYSIDIMYML